MATGVIQKGEIKTRTPCRARSGYTAKNKSGKTSIPGGFADSEWCGMKPKKKTTKKKGTKKRKSTKKKTTKKKVAKGKTATGKKVGYFKKKGRCFRRLKSGRVKFAKAHNCK